VRGGSDHAKFQHAAYAALSLSGARPEPADEAFSDDSLMRAWRTDPRPESGWSADWRIEDHYGTATARGPVGLRYTDFTEGAAMQACEGWVSSGGFDKMEEAWVPRVVVRRKREEGSEAPLASDFVGILEPYEGGPKIVAARRADTADNGIALEIRLASGRVDVVAEHAIAVGGKTIWKDRCAEGGRT
jgi:hypothetical protein